MNFINPFKLSTYFRRVGDNTIARVSHVNAVIEKVNELENAGSSLPYTIYTALLTQTGPNNPDVIVLQNTTGLTFNWVRDGDPGTFMSEQLLDISKVVCFIANGPISNNGIRYNLPNPSFGYFNITTITKNTDPIVFADDLLHYTTVEIRIYN